MTITDIFTDIENLQSVPGIDVQIIGYSVLNNPVYAIHIGCYDCDQIIVEGAIHAREYITAPLLVQMATYLNGKVTEFGIYFIPLVNPDGVALVLQGANMLLPPFKEFVIQVNNNSTDFSEWKANINAVDLNVNFDALWGGGSQNVTTPMPANFIGYQPNSEPEVNALIQFTKQVNPVLTLSYHTKGEIIYWGFEVLNQQELKRDGYIVNKLAAYTDYEPIQTQYSTGGYSDWVSLTLKVPAFTIEVGSDSLPHPIMLSQLPTIFEQNKDVPIVAYNALIQYNKIVNRQ